MIRRFMHNESGFTLAEQLFTIVLVGLLGIVVAAGIGVATRTYTNVRDVADTHSALNTAVTTISDELRYAEDIVAVSAGSGASASNTGLPMGQLYAFDSVGDNARICLVNTHEGISVQAIKPSDVQGGVKVQADEIPAVSSGAASIKPLINMPNDSDIVVQVTSINYNNSNRQWTFELGAYKAPTWSGNSIASAPYTATTGTITVHALN